MTDAEKRLIRSLERAFEAGRHTDLTFARWLEVSKEGDLVRDAAWSYAAEVNG